MAAFFLLVAVPVAVVILVLSFLFRQEAVGIARGRMQEAVARSAQNLDTEAQSFALFTSALMNDRGLMDHARVYASSSDPQVRYTAARGMEASVTWFFRITSRIGSVFLFFPDGQQFSFSNYPASNVDFAAARAAAEEPGRPLGEVWCLDTLNALPGAVEQPPVISMAVSPRRPGSRESPTSVDSILVSFRIPFLDQLYAGGSGEEGVSYLVNREGKVILSDHREATGKSFAELRRSLAGKYLVIDAPMPSTGWTFAEAIPLNRITRNVDLIMRYVYAALVIVSLLFAFYTHAFFSDIIDPLRAMIAQMGRVSDGDFSVRVPVDGTVEFRSLGVAFNRMVLRLDDLTAQIVEEQRERTKTEIEALRFQLNPHFVCNTLNAIGMMASIAKVDSIKRMTGALTRIMREILSADDTLFSLEEELKNLESYVYIMKIRFGDTFDFVTEVGSELLRVGIPTMLLQPLVENAILHGLRGRPAGGTIAVSAAAEGESHLRLEVRDDGVGMDSEKLGALFAAPRENAGGLNRIGLYNVRRRVVLSYGPPCDVRVESFPGAGTVVTVLLPLLPGPASRVDAAVAAGSSEVEEAPR